MLGSAPRCRARAALAVIVAAGSLAPVLLPGPAGARVARKQHPQPRQILVVTANLEEAWNAQDNADSSDMRAFVRRLSRVTPHAPDVLLLQEVTRRSTRKVVKLLKRKTSQRYAIAVSAGRRPARVKDGIAFSRETSIVFNARRMRMIGKGRLINTTHRQRHGRPWTPWEVKRNAAALLRERGTGVTFPVASVHFHTTSQLRSKSVARRYRAMWSRRVAKVVSREWPHYRRHAVVGGDFNETRSRWQNGSKVVERWWRALRRLGFRDSVFEVRDRGGVDYVFTRTRIAEAGLDSAYYPKKAAGTSSYYSDHRLRWALLGRWRPRVRADVVSSTVVGLSWKALPSAKKIQVERKRPGSPGWHVATKVRGSSTGVNDRRLDPATRYLYRVVAWNGAEWSRASRIRRVKTKPDTTRPLQPAAPDLGLKVKPLNGQEPLKARPTVVRLTWPRTYDRGGSGIAGYEVWRTELGRDPKLITKTETRRYVDRNFYKRRTKEYFVVAFDKVGNRSRRSDAATVLHFGPAT